MNRYIYIYIYLYLYIYVYRMVAFSLFSKRDNDPQCLICVRGVETTNQIISWSMNLIDYIYISTTGHNPIPLMLDTRHKTWSQICGFIPNKIMVARARLILGEWD